MIFMFVHIHKHGCAVGHTRNEHATYFRVMYVDAPKHHVSMYVCIYKMPEVGKIKIDFSAYDSNVHRHCS